MIREPPAQEGLEQQFARSCENKHRAVLLVNPLTSMFFPGHLTLAIIRERTLVFTKSFHWPSVTVFMLKNWFSLTFVWQGFFNTDGSLHVTQTCCIVGQCKDMAHFQLSAWWFWSGTSKSPFPNSRMEETGPHKVSLKELLKQGEWKGWEEIKIGYNQTAAKPFQPYFSPTIFPVPTFGWQHFTWLRPCWAGIGKTPSLT